MLALVAAASGAVGPPAVFDAWRRLLGAPSEPGPGGGELLLSGALAIVVVLAVRDRALPVPRVLGEWLYLERAAAAVVWRPLMALARSLARFDDQVVDGAVRSVPRAGMATPRPPDRPFSRACC